MKTTLLILSGLFGIGTAFTNIPTHFNGTTYYAITDGAGGICSTKTKPQPPLFCDVTRLAYCTIVTKNGYVPVCNQLPTSAQATTIRQGVYH